MSECNKQRIKLKEFGYLGPVCFLEDLPVTMTTVRCLYEQVLATGKPKTATSLHTLTLLAKMFILHVDSSPSFRDLLAVVSLSHRADLSVRLDICRKVSLGILDKTQTLF